MTDTHTHLYLPEFADDADDTVRRAIDVGVGRMVFPNVDLSTVRPMVELADRFPDNIRCAIGLHPTEVGPEWRDTLEAVLTAVEPYDWAAIGEVGIDLYWDKTWRDEQMQAFDRQLAIAAERRLPVIIHCREGLDETLEVLEGHRDVTAIFHSFGGSADDVGRIRRLSDWYFGINGIVTFKNSTLRETLPAIGLDRILLETDSPYLSPAPLRGKRNESSRIPLIASAVAGALGVGADEVERVTDASAASIFAF